MTQHSPKHRSFLPAAVACLAALCSSGCITVTVYQPLVSLQRPVVVDPQVANFEGARLLVRCFPGEAIAQTDAATLCRKVAGSFRNQGAEVEEDVPTDDGRSFVSDFNPELIVELRSRNLHAEESALLMYLAYTTLTIVPAVSEENFSSDVTIKDGNGFLLASDNLQARFVNYVGIGMWAVNYVLDVAVRPDDEEVTGDAAKRQFSKDYYRQLSQLVLDARMRAEVLRGFSAPPAAPRQGTN